MEKEERIEVKKIKFLKDDPYFNYVSVKLTNGEKFLVMGEIDKFGRFHVKRKRGSILPYYVEIGSDEEQDEAYDYYLQKKLIVTRKVKTFECYSLEENYENAIADAIIIHGKEWRFNLDPIIHFKDYSLQRSEQE